MATARTFTVPPDLADQTLAAAIRQLAGGLSWSEAKRLIETRRVLVGGTVCLDIARRLKAGDVLTLQEHSRAPVPREQDVPIVHADADLVIVDKPAGVLTLRRPEELDWPEQRKRLQPTLDELLQRKLARGGSKPPRLRPVHRLDRDTSGLMLFALAPAAEQALIRMFSAHDVRRIYLAVVHGRLAKPRTIETWLVRDRGDGLRGSSPLGKDAPEADEAITHIRPIEPVGKSYTLVECRLETGRTHQIRIHLAEAGHMLCGEKVYTRATPGAEPVVDRSRAPRQALHSAELELTHPITGQLLRFSSPWPRDLANWLQRLRIER